MFSFRFIGALALLLFTTSPFTPAQSSPAATAPAPVATRTSSLADAGPSSLSLPALRRQIESGHAEQALTQLDLLAAQIPAPAEAQSLRGLALYVLNRMSQAEAAYALAMLANPSDDEARQMRGLTLYRMGRPAEAIPLLEARTSDPTTDSNGAPASAAAQDKADPNYVLALCFLDTRRYDDARRAFAAQYGFPPESAAAYLLAARMLLRREYLPIARESAEKALQLDPHLPLAHALLGEVALAGNHLEDAIAQLTAEREANPLEGSVYDRLGDAYSRAGQYPEAQSALQQAVLLEPQATGPYILLGKVMLKRQNAVGAATYLERAKTMDPSNYMTRNLLSQAYRAMGRRDEATQEMQAAEQLQAASEPKLVSPK